jgi:hypothetical protein
VESHDGAKGEAGHDDERERFVSHLCELAGKLGKFEWGSKGIDNDPQAEQPYLSHELN